MAARPAHIAVVSVPAHGHVNPHLGLVRELVRRGHRVTYANDPSFAHVIEPTGATLKPYATTLPIHGTTQDAWPEDPVAGQRLFLVEGQAALPQLQAAYAGDTPDLVLHDTTGFAGAVLAHEWGVPAIQLWPHLAPWSTYEQDNAEMLAAMRALPGYDAYRAEFAAWLTENGLDADVDAFVAQPELLSQFLRGSIGVERVVTVYDSVLGLLERVQDLGARPRLTSDGEFYGRRDATGVVCPPLRAAAMRFTG